MRGAALALLIGLLVGCAVHATPPEPPMLEKAIPQLRQPRPNLATGGQPEASAWKELVKRSFTTVINLRAPAEMAGRDEAAEVHAAGLAYHAIPVASGEDISLDNARALWALVRQAEGGVLVHCASGNRAGALLALGAADAGMLAAEALEFGRASGMTSAESRVRELLEMPPRP